MKKEEILIGKTLEEAIETLRNCNYRIIKNNLSYYPITDDIQIDRYNLYIENNLITEVKMF